MFNLMSIYYLLTLFPFILVCIFKQQLQILKLYSEPKTLRQCCSGYKNGTEPNQCIPVCDPECANAVCEAPNTCVCFPGHTITNISNSTCYDICDSCINGNCSTSKSECTCFEGYQRDSTFKHACNPVCSPACVNSICTAQNKCDCYDKFEKDPNKNNVCLPKCTKMCVFGNCTDPDECSCFDGYINDEQSPHVCVPKCDQRCENGFCESPNSCKCSKGFQKHPRNPEKCFPQQPENSTLSFCELRLPKAIKYGKSSDCYIMKEKILIKSDSQCQPLNALSQPMCSQGSSSSPCAWNFQCSATAVNNTAIEIHCDLGSDDFGTVTSSNIAISDDDDNWQDVVLVLYSFQKIDLITENLTRNQTHEWALHPLRKMAVCGQKHFVLEVSSLSNPVASSSEALSTQSGSIKIISLIVIFTLLSGAAGAGIWFYWTKHRRLNDPLNYRENMLRGFNNQGYEDHNPSELLAMDESQEDL